MVPRRARADKIQLLRFSTEQHVMETTARTVYSMIHEQSKEQQLSNLERISDIIDASYFLLKNEIAHTTNYTALLNLVSRLDGSRQIQMCPCI